MRMNFSHSSWPPEFHWMCVRSWTAPLHVCFVLRRLSTLNGCVQAAFQSAAQLDSHKTTTFHVYYRIKCDRGLWKPLISTSGLALHIMTVYLWSYMKYDLASTQSVLFWNLLDVLMLTSCPTQSALCWIAALCYVPWQKQKPCVSAAEGSTSPELWRSKNVTQPQSVDAHTLTGIKTNQLRWRSGAETHHTHIWWNLGVTSWQKMLLTNKWGDGDN